VIGHLNDPEVDNILGQIYRLWKIKKDVRWVR
jgi:hypothetical protein